jgi:hypothetical protein
MQIRTLYQPLRFLSLDGLEILASLTGVVSPFTIFGVEQTSLIFGPALLS